MRARDARREKTTRLALLGEAPQGARPQRCGGGPCEKHACSSSDDVYGQYESWTSSSWSGRREQKKVELADEDTSKAAKRTQLRVQLEPRIAATLADSL